MKLKARNTRAARTERACPRAAPLLEAMLQQRWQVAVHLAGHAFVLCLAQGFLRAVSPTWLLLLGCHSLQEIQI